MKRKSKLITSRGDDQQKQQFFADLKNIHHERRAALVRGLYERFGDLPKGLLEDEGLQTAPGSG